MHIERRFLNWGVFFILLGAVPLAVQQGLVNRDAVSRAWQLWPLLIIAAGVGLVSRKTSFEFLGGLIAAATFGLMLGGVVAVGLDLTSIAASCGGTADRAFPTQQGSLGDRATVRVEFGCGDLTIDTAAGNGWTLSGLSSDGSGPRLDAASDHLTLRGNDSPGGFFGLGVRQKWTVIVPTDPTLDLDLTLNASPGTLELGGAHLARIQVQGNASAITMDLGAATVQRLDLQFNAGSARVNLPATGLTGDFQVNAGSIAFCVPERVGIRITSGDNVTSSNNYADAGLTKSGSTWQSANYSSAESRIDLTANANAGGFTLNPKDGCR